MSKLTRGNPRCEFTVQQLLPGHGPSARLPHGECKELCDGLPCGDGDRDELPYGDRDELPAGKERDTGTAGRTSRTWQPVAACSCGCNMGRAGAGNDPKAFTAGKRRTKNSAVKFPLLARLQELGPEDALMHSSRPEHLMRVLHVRGGRIERNV